jgi:hypothetical protein
MRCEALYDEMTERTAPVEPAVLGDRRLERVPLVA